MTYRKVTEYGEGILKDAGIADAKNDAWLLMETVCRIDRSFYYLHMEEEFPEEQLHEYEITLRKRAEHIPLQYIAGGTEFMGLKFKVNSGVLIPRQDTETLVEEALKAVRPGMKVLDLCTGSGCVIVSILHNASGVKGYATDISKLALNVARENARLNGVQVFFERSDLFDNVQETFDMIVSNPPYIASGEIPGLMPEVRSFEPLEALDGGEDGLYFYRRIAAECAGYMNPGGQIFLETGWDQGRVVLKLLRDAGFSMLRIVKDPAGRDRVVTGRYDVCRGMGASPE